MPDRRSSDTETLTLLHGIDKRLAVIESEFGTVKSLVYGLVGCILLAFLGALTALVMHARPN